jgi:SPT2 chromatin protein
MAKAKAVQKEAPKVGVLKHQAALPKVKISKSEKKRRMEVVSKKKEAPRPGKKPSVRSGPAARSDAKPNVDVSKKREVGENAYKGTSRAPQASSYKGTSNLPTRHGDAGRERRRAPRRDEYLGTDEEDEGDFYGDYDDYYSDRSSDMEAGLEDMEEEEYEALRTAQREDAEDVRKEAEAKKAKLERKQKLAALARSRR